MQQFALNLQVHRSTKEMRNFSFASWKFRGVLNALCPITKDVCNYQLRDPTSWSRTPENNPHHTSGRHETAWDIFSSVLTPKIMVNLDLSAGWSVLMPHAKDSLHQLKSQAIISTLERKRLQPTDCIQLMHQNYFMVIPRGNAPIYMNFTYDYPRSPASYTITFHQAYQRRLVKFMYASPPAPILQVLTAG